MDSWVFGCMLYELLFGIPPPSYIKTFIAASANIN